MLCARWYWFVRWAVRVFFFRLSGGFRIVGTANVPRSGPLIVSPNHVSNLDPPAIACSIPRMITFMAKSELFKVPIFGPLIRSLGSFPVHRGEADTEAIRLALRLLGEGRAVLVFPEGTRGDGEELLPFNRGAALLAKRSGAPVLPVGIVGTHRKMPKCVSFSKWGPTYVAFGEPLTYAQFTIQGQEKAAKDAFTSELQRRILDLCASGGLELRTCGSEQGPKTRGGSGEATESTPSAPA